MQAQVLDMVSGMTDTHLKLNRHHFRELPYTGKVAIPGLRAVVLNLSNAATL